MEISSAGVVKVCKEIGCCDACCVRYLGIKSPLAYENSHEYVNKILKSSEPNDKTDSTEATHTAEATHTNNCKDENTDTSESVCEGTPSKRARRTVRVCVSCVGVLQEDTWQHSIELAKEVMENKKYAKCAMACALSAPIATFLRERAVTLTILEQYPQYHKQISVTPLKEAWKWSFAPRLCCELSRELQSGSSAPLLVTINMEYPDETQELEVIRTLSGSSPTRDSVERWSRREVEGAVAGVDAARWRAAGGWVVIPSPRAPARAVSVTTQHVPAYVGGRYVKLSRELPQTPWVVEGRRVMPSSVQEIIFKPVAELYQISESEIESRLKFMAAGREDVDVRCLGDGRPFAIEIADPRREPTLEQLQEVCRKISESDQVKVKILQPVTKQQLTELKQGEEHKLKTYSALCVKLSHSVEDKLEGATIDTPVTVTQRDIDNINTWLQGEQSGIIHQRTPLRVLHRRALHTRARRVTSLHASTVTSPRRDVTRSDLLLLTLQTEAGTYVKEWAHGELRRTSPALRDVMRARTDILALDVQRVHLDWPSTAT